MTWPDEPQLGPERCPTARTILLVAQAQIEKIRPTGHRSIRLNFQHVVVAQVIQGHGRLASGIVITTVSQPNPPRYRPGHGGLSRDFARWREMIAEQ